jgi:hypothetical protein
VKEFIELKLIRSLCEKLRFSHTPLSLDFGQKDARCTLIPTY